MRQRLHNLLPFKVAGKVVEGKGRGRTLGFPTANIVPHGGVLPDLPQGVYAARVKLGARQYLAMASFGPAETFGETLARLEVHLFGLRSDLYGRELELELVKYLRPMKKFAATQELIEAMAKDREETLEIFKTNSQTL